MQDTITALINAADQYDKYLDDAALEELDAYLETMDLRIKATEIVSANAAAIIREAVSQTLLYGNDITVPGGYMYTTRRYANMIRDLEYFLRQITYAMLAANNSILDDRTGETKEILTALGVPLDRTVETIQAMKEIVIRLVGKEAGKEMAVAFDYLCSSLGASSTMDELAELAA